VSLDGIEMKPTVMKPTIVEPTKKNDIKINKKAPKKISKNVEKTSKNKNKSFLDGLKSVFKIDDTPLGQPRCPIRDVIPLPIKYEKYNEL
jgi:hypothetical protein